MSGPGPGGFRGRITTDGSCLSSLSPGRSPGCAWAWAWGPAWAFGKSDTSRGATGRTPILTTLPVAGKPSLPRPCAMTIALLLALAGSLALMAYIVRRLEQA